MKKRALIFGLALMMTTQPIVVSAGNLPVEKEPCVHFVKWEDAHEWADEREDNQSLEKRHGVFDEIKEKKRNTLGKRDERLVHHKVVMEAIKAFLKKLK